MENLPLHTHREFIGKHSRVLVCFSSCLDFIVFFIFLYVLQRQRCAVKFNILCNVCTATAPTTTNGYFSVVFVPGSELNFFFVCMVCVCCMRARSRLPRTSSHGNLPKATRIFSSLFFIIMKIL